MFLTRAPKSLYRPGSSTDVLIFQEGRIDFAPDLVDNMQTFKADAGFPGGLAGPWWRRT